MFLLRQHQPVSISSPLIKILSCIFWEIPKFKYKIECKSKVINKRFASKQKIEIEEYIPTKSSTQLESNRQHNSKHFCSPWFKCKHSLVQIQDKGTCPILIPWACGLVVNDILMTGQVSSKAKHLVICLFSNVRVGQYFQKLWQLLLF